VGPVWYVITPFLRLSPTRLSSCILLHLFSGAGVVTAVAILFLRPTLLTSVGSALLSLLWYSGVFLLLVVLIALVVELMDIWQAVRDGAHDRRPLQSGTTIFRPPPLADEETLAPQVILERRWGITTPISSVLGELWVCL
jgi:hypothetical protein